MSDLAKMRCVPCEGDVDPLTDEQIRDYLTQVPEWTVVEDPAVKKLERTYSFDDFAAALAFTNRVGEAAEEQGHHPVLTTTWGRVTVTWWTHAIGGLHENDFVMAAKTDELYGAAQG